MTDLSTVMQDVAVTAINEMLRDKHFSICTVRDVAAMLNVNPDCQEYRILKTLHCVDYADMTKNVRDAIPGLIAACLDQNVFQFPLPSERLKATVIEAPQKPAAAKFRLPWSRGG